jgi:peptidyl-dipeptidase Dcp
MQNPLLLPSPYRNNVPPYDLVKTEHFLPALEEAIKISKQEIEEIKNQPQPNFTNIIEAYEASGKQLETVVSVFFHFDSALSTDELQAISEEFKTKLTQYESDVSLDEKLFSQIKAVYDIKKNLKLTEEQDLLLTDIYKGFARNGALLNPQDKEKLRNIDEKLALLKNDFGNKLLAETNDFQLFVDNEKDLSGLPEGAKVAAKISATEAGQSDKWLFTLQAPSLIPVLTYADNRELREKIWRAQSTKCVSGKNDNRENVLQLVKLRDERAKLLGYNNHADYVLEERMAKTTKAVMDMHAEYINIVKPLAKNEHEELKKFVKDKFGVTEVKPWDVGYYAEKMKQAIFGFDSEQLRPYFQFEKVRQGAFDVASKLYNIKFKKSSEYPLYHEEVETFEVIDNETNELVGVLYTDYYPRKTKQGGAWMNDYVKQNTSNGKRTPPIIGNHGNFTKPTADKPSLLSLLEVLTLFHEFGHGLHGLLSNTRYKAQAGTNVKWDFVELPSQIMENWVKEKEVLNMFAKHFESGENIPSDLVDKMITAENFRSASAFHRQIMFSYLDMMWHSANVSDVNSIEQFERTTLKDLYILDPEGGYISPSFSHIFDGGYSAGYYSYKWAEILDADAFEAFKENGLFDSTTAKKFRKLLASGGSRDPEILYLEFRGKKPDPKALLRRKGLAA